MHDPRANSADSDRYETRLSLRNARGDELVVEAAGESKAEKPAETVIATNAEGRSLTLLEEYALRRQQPKAWELTLSFLCAAASLAFAALIYFKSN